MQTRGYVFSVPISHLMVLKIVVPHLIIIIKSEVWIISNCLALAVSTWWRHQMETFSALLAICVENSPVTGEFPAQRPVTRSLDVFFEMRPHKRLINNGEAASFETPLHPLWRHCNYMHVWIFSKQHRQINVKISLLSFSSYLFTQPPELAISEDFHIAVKYKEEIVSSNLDTKIRTVFTRKRLWVGHNIAVSYIWRYTYVK